MAKWCLGVAIAYAINPFDIIPDFIPVVGHLDDVVLIPLLIWIAIKLIPKDVVRECREKHALLKKDSSLSFPLQ